MIFHRLERFDKAYRRLDRQDQRRVDKALITLARDPLHSSLHTEKVGGDIWSFRASHRLRLTFNFEGGIDELKRAESITLRNAGYHDEVYSSP